MIPGLFDHGLVHWEFAVPVDRLQERLDLFLSHLILYTETLKSLQSKKKDGGEIITSDLIANSQLISNAKSLANHNRAYLHIEILKAAKTA